MRFRNQPPKVSLWTKLVVKYRETSIKALWTYAGLGFVGLVLTGLATFQHHQYILRTSEFNLLALKELKKHQKIIDIVGEPIKVGHVFTRKRNSIYFDFVDCVVPVYGKNTDGVIKYQADKYEGDWIIRKMEFTFLDEAGGVIRLIKNGKSTV